MAKFARAARCTSAFAVLALTCASGAVAGSAQAAASDAGAAQTREANPGGPDAPADPYTHLEKLAAEEVRRWAADQSQRTNMYLESQPLTEWLADRIRAHAEDVVEPEQPRRAVDQAFRLTALEPEGHRLLMIKRADGASSVFIDPTDFGPGKSISGFHVSPDGAHVAYSLSDRGSEWVETRIRRVVDGLDLPESLDGIIFGRPVWSRDGKGFFYVRNRRPRPGQRVALAAPAVFHHRLNSPQERDPALFRTPEDSVEILLDLRLSDSGRLLYIYEGTGAHQPNLGQVLTRLHILDLKNPEAPDVESRPIALTPGRDATYRVVAEQGDRILYVITDHGAPRRRLVAIDRERPDPSHWRDIIPESEAVLQSVQVIGGKLVASELINVQSRVRVFTLAGSALASIDLPLMSTILDIREGEAETELVVRTTSFLEPVITTRLELASGAVNAERVKPRHFDPEPYEVRQVWFGSTDGTQVPMFVAHRRGLVFDGSHPTLLFGYGASAQMMTPGYREDVIAWLELGGVYAYPNLRGGGEFGREWYEAATLERKQTTFDDFIAAAEFLIREGYTKPDKLAIQGISYGGMLVSAVITQRPDLFAAAIAEVPVTDLLRFDLGRHRAQLGWSGDPEHRAFLTAYSPLHRVANGTCYPSTLITTALNDDRVPAWHALKFAAALQDAQFCQAPILLRAEPGGGHGIYAEDNWVQHMAASLSFAAERVGARVPEGSDRAER